jgi:hypothetical protein
MKSECDGFKALMMNDLHASVHENGYVLLFEGGGNGMF